MQTAKQTVSALINLAEQTGATVLETFPCWFDGGDGQERFDALKKNLQALTAYRLCRLALSDLSIELPEDVPTACGIGLPNEEEVKAALARWKQIVGEASQSAEAMSADSPCDSSTTFEFALAQEIAARPASASAMLSTEEVAATFEQLEIRRAAVEAKLSDFTGTGDGKANVTRLVDAGKYFLKQYVGSHKEVMGDFSNAIEKAKAKQTKETLDDAALMLALLGLSEDELYTELGKSLLGLDKSSTQAAYAVLATDELTSAENLLSEAQAESARS